MEISSKLAFSKQPETDESTLYAEEMVGGYQVIKKAIWIYIQTYNFSHLTF